VNFLFDAQLPRRLAVRLRELGHDTVHTLDLPRANKTTDEEINEISVRELRVVVTRTRTSSTRSFFAGNEQRQTVDALLKYYGDRISQWLSDLTHREEPWLDARKDLSPGERGSQVISHASMAEYYGSLV
jgi:hypothetical protein